MASPGPDLTAARRKAVGLHTVITSVNPTHLTTNVGSLALVLVHAVERRSLTGTRLAWAISEVELAHGQQQQQQHNQTPLRHRRDLLDAESVCTASR